MFVSLLLLAACTTDGKLDDTSSSGNGSGDNGSADTDTDTDTDTAIDQCSPYSAIKNGRSWTWSYADSGLSGTFVTTITAFDGARGTLRQDLQYSNASYSMHSTTDGAFHCADGLVFDSQTSTYSGTSSGTPFSGTGTTTYSAGGPQLPLAIEAGDRWTVHYAGESTYNPGGTSSFDYTTAYVAPAEETVSVGAGTFTAWHLDATTTSGGVATTSITWVTANVGNVRSSSTELESWTE